MRTTWWGSLLAVPLVLASLVAGPTPTAAQAGPTVTTQVVESADGTPLLSTLFVPAGADADRPAPLVLLTHGWGGTGQRDAGGFVGRLLDAGYVVLTWDQRGFGCSGGEVQIDKPDAEGQDVRALIDWAVENAPIEADDAGDPLVGMTGGSYAGGIQTAASSVDERIDAIAPEISWHDLRYSLYSGEVVNQGWATLLYLAGQATASGQGLDPSCPTYPQPGGLDPAITQGFTEGSTTGAISAGVLDFFARSSLASYGRTQPVDIPTLVIQGSTDTLFDLTDGWRIFEHVQATGAPARFVVFCGGHVACPSTYAPVDDGEHVDRAVLAWFERHLRGDSTVDVGPVVEYRTNEGVWRAADGFPGPGAAPLTATGSGSLVSVPIVEPPDLTALAGLSFDGGIPALPFTSASVSSPGDIRAMAVEVAQATGAAVDLFGIPTVRLQVDGVGDEVILMAKLVDRESGEVVNLQEGAVRVSLLDGPAEVDVPMPGVAYTLPAGHHLDLQVSTASLMHSNARTPATVDVTASVEVPVQPVARAVQPTAPPAAPAPSGPPATLPATGPAGTPSSAGALAAALIGAGLLVVRSGVRRRGQVSC